MGDGKIECVARAQFTVWSRQMLAHGHPPTDILYQWETTDGGTRDYWRTQARAAVEAMRLPTDAMADAPWKANIVVGEEGTWSTYVSSDSARLIWEVMIDEVLKDRQP